MPERGDLFVQRNGATAYELNRFSRSDAKALILTEDELRWLVTAGGPGALAPLPSPAEAAARRRTATVDPEVAPPPAGGTGDGAAASLPTKKTKN